MAGSPHASNCRNGAMPASQILPFLLFSLVAAITPGPSNVMVAATGGAVGFPRGIPCALGASLGMGALMFAAATGLGQIVLAVPVATTLVRWAGAAFLLWLAWKIASAGAPSDAPNAPAVRPTGFLGAAAFQWLNPKGWMVALSAAGTYLVPGSAGPFAAAAMLAGLFVLAAMPASLTWLGLGAALRSLLRNPRAARAFNLAMAAALVASVLLVLR